MKKNTYVFLLVFTLILVTAVFLFAKEEPMADPVVFQVQTENGTEQIKPFFDGKEIYHIFLPANCRKNDLIVYSAQRVKFNGGTLVSGAAVTWPEMGMSYPLEVGGQEYVLQFHQASNVATMFIDTRSGSMDHIHEDKTHTEAVTVTLYAKDGSLDYRGETDTLKGRGNATWACQKKPYTLTLSAKADLLGMGSASKWVLLANAMDESNLHNMLAFTLAQQAELGWIPDRAYVELYLNGKYNGLYLLTEKVESGVDRLNIDPSDGDFLAAVEPNRRQAILDRPIFTRQGRVIELCEPEYPSGVEAEKIQFLETEIFSAVDGEFPVSLDMDSWVKRYLVDEICANIDADLASSYFYYKDGSFFAGPVWDYDMSFGNQITNENPETFLAKNAVRSRAFATPYDTALLENEAFRVRVTELYQTCFLPILEELLQAGIQELAKEISAASQMNSLRWKGMFDKNPVTNTTAEGICSYLRKRVDFLSSAWIDGVEYCTLQFELIPNGGACWSTAVAYGETLSQNFLQTGGNFQYLGLDDLDEDAVWVIHKTGEVFDISQPVTEDLFLVQKQEEQPRPKETHGSGSTAVLHAVFVPGLFGVFFLGLLVIAFRRGAQERRQGHGRD